MAQREPQSQLRARTMLAVQLAAAPLYSCPMPPVATFWRSSWKAVLPCTCSVVLKVSTGVSMMRHVAPPALATAVLNATGTPGHSASISASTPTLAAVSPKRDSGFWIIANDTPL